MHKFTIFTILLSAIVVLIVADVVLNDYWGEDFASETVLEEEISSNWVTTEVVNPESRGDDDESPVPELSIPEASSIITSELLVEAGLTTPDLITEPYDGLIYGFWDVAEAFADWTVWRHKIFVAANYVGSIYEVRTPTEVDVFEAYQTLLDLAVESESGEFNETNAYGEGSFYLNHSSKTNTVFLVLYKNGSVYAFEYSPSYHVQIRSLIDLL